MKTYIQGKVNSTAGQIAVKLDFIVYHEDKCWIYYCPALDLCGYGRTKRRAEHSLMTTLKIFFDYTVKENTLSSVLSGLGWSVVPGKVMPPSIAAMYSGNESLKEIVDNCKFTREFSSISIPALA